MEVSVDRPAPSGLTPSLYCTEILEFDPNTTDWNEVAQLENGRYDHSTVAVLQPSSYCDNSGQL